MKISWLKKIIFDRKGLIPAIVQDYQSGLVLMLAWMNQESLIETISSGQAVYWSRSRKKLWRKGEESGHIQVVFELRLDCDGDTILLKVNQKKGIACHTGHASCFFQYLQKKINDDISWEIIDSVIKDPKYIYEKS